VLSTSLAGVALIWFKDGVARIDHVAPMKISDITCPSCLASYEVAESLSVKGRPGRAQCSVCGELLASWQEPKLKAYRLILPPQHKYPTVPVPPPPLSS
jgi:zinc-ribbon domain